MTKPPDWKPLDPVGLKARLAEVRALLVQAAAVGLAQDTDRLEKLAELERKLRETPHGPTRRYR
ncbi:MAG TPA: hypothetical protein VLM79_08150 [Kofleriaceae bacterium]|jgi:hypothetical protein|nr:hypothetical protein [Kofleriaceae bacterium]